MGMRKLSSGEEFTPALRLNMSDKERDYLRGISEEPVKSIDPVGDFVGGVMEAAKDSPTVTPTGDRVQREYPKYLPDEEVNTETKTSSLEDTFNRFYGRETEPTVQEKVDDLNAQESEEIKKSTPSVPGDPTAKKVDEEKIKEIQKEKKRLAPDLAVEKMGELSRRGFQDDWERDNHFPETALRFFLNVLDGVPLGSAYMDASAFYDNRVATDKRHAYRQELLDDGYSPESIDKWVTTGNQDDLMDRDKRMMDRRKDELGLSQSEATLQSTLLGNQQKQNDLDAYDPDYEEKIKNLNLQDKELGLKVQQATIRKLNSQIAKSAAEKASKMTEAQQKAKFGYNRARAGQEIWDSNYRTLGTDYPLASFLGNRQLNLSEGDSIAKSILDLTNPELAKAQAEEMGYLSGVLRPESGSAIGMKEWDTYGRFFFPRRGDGARDLARKAVFRDLTTESLNVAAINDAQAEQLVGILTASLSGVEDYNRSAGAVKINGSWYSLEELKNNLL